jgi:hypothetical protein
MWYDEFVNMMDNAAAVKKSILILGDFNIDLFKSHLAWESTITLFGLKQLIKEPTRITPTSNTLIDHIYCTHPLNVTNVRTLHNAMSDHCPLHVFGHVKRPVREGGNIFMYNIGPPNILIRMPFYLTSVRRILTTYTNAVTQIKPLIVGIKSLQLC